GCDTGKIHAVRSGTAALCIQPTGQVQDRMNLPLSLSLSLSLCLSLSLSLSRSLSLFVTHSHRSFFLSAYLSLTFLLPSLSLSSLLRLLSDIFHCLLLLSLLLSPPLPLSFSLS